jgi:guanosine-3',5'-bis(diphosphate) 3'-pyrophosphohydrolase
MSSSNVAPVIHGYSLSQADFVGRFGNGLNDADIELVRRAYLVGEAFHRGQTRDEGTPYFNHPIRVATILFDEIGLSDTTIICGAVLHDVIEDSDVTEGDIKVMFNDEIATAVRLLTKVHGIPTSDYLNAIEHESPNIALPIKLCDRLDNLRSLHLSKKPEKRQRYLNETNAYFLPLAERHNEYVYRELKSLVAELS